MEYMGKLRRGPLLLDTLSNAIRCYYIKPKSNMQYARDIGAQTKYLIWKIANGAPRNFGSRPFLSFYDAQCAML